MTEAAANGVSQAGIDFATVKLALFSSSTKTRIAQLRAIDEKLNEKSAILPFLSSMSYVLYIILDYVLTYTFVFSYRPVFHTKTITTTL